MRNKERKDIIKNYCNSHPPHIVNSRREWNKIKTKTSLMLLFSDASDASGAAQVLKK